MDDKTEAAKCHTDSLWSSWFSLDSTSVVGCHPFLKSYDYLVFLGLDLLSQVNRHGIVLLALGIRKKILFLIVKNE